MPRTVWYPGHMARGRRQIEALASSIDLLIEVRDARAPRLTSSPALTLFSKDIQTVSVLSKADLSYEPATRNWINFLKENGIEAWALDLRHGGMAQIRRALSVKKPTFRDLRIAVVGVPNVGKSMLINQLVGRKSAVVGGIPGVTRGVSWFKGQGFLLVDSPGILDPHEDARAHRIISWLGASRSEVIGNYEEHAKECIKFLIDKKLWRLVEQTWGIPEENTSDILVGIAKRLGKLRAGGIPDTEAAGKAVIDSFAQGKFGRMTLELPQDAPLWEMLK